MFTELNIPICNGYSRKDYSIGDCDFLYQQVDMTNFEKGLNYHVMLIKMLEHQMMGNIRRTRRLTIRS